LVNKSVQLEVTSLDQFFENANATILQLPYRASNYLFIFIMEGKGVHEIDGVTYLIKENDLLIIRRSRLHCFKQYDQLRGYIVSFSEGFKCEMFGASSSPVTKLLNDSLLSPHFKGLDVHFNSIHSLIITLENLTSGQGQVIDRKVTGSVFNGLAHLLENISCSKTGPSNTNNNRLLEFTKLINEKYSHEKTVEGYAEHMHITKKTLNQLTRNHLGLTAKQYIDQHIITILKRKLSFEETSINEIAYEMGFSEPSNMTRFFKKNVGVTPKTFRNNIRDRAVEWIKYTKSEFDHIEAGMENNLYYISPQAVVPLHSHSEMDEIFYCVKGSGYAVLEHEERDLKAGETFIAHANVLHSLRSRQGMYVVSILVPK